jgi:hypothetical protein
LSVFALRCIRPAMPHRPCVKLIGSLALALALAGCGGGEVGGELSGLGSGLSVTLLNNGSDSLTLGRNGPFTFRTALDAGAAYAVTVKTQPAGQTCTVGSGSGTLNAEGDSVDTVRVSCSTEAVLRGRLEGLAVGTAVTLVNGNDRLALTVNGAFAFAETLTDGTEYAVLVLTQPAIGSCIVRNGSGRFFAATFTDIVVSCN